MQDWRVLSTPALCRTGLDLGRAAMTLWLMRAGKVGERESLALQEQVAIIGWDELPDMTACRTRAELEALMRGAYPGQKPRTLSSWHGQLWSVRDGIKTGDMVVLPLKSRAAVALGTVAGEYRYRRDLGPTPLHTRPVQWHAEVPRHRFDIDILLSFGAFMSVCRIERNDAEQRVRSLLSEGACRGGTGPAPPAGPEPLTLSRALTRTLPPAVLRPSAAADLERRSRELIRERIAQKFKGHGLATLVAALLEAQGYRTRLSPPGPDGGVDILAGSGPLGFDGPRLVVQVKSQDTKVDVRPLRELSGVMCRFGADRGLLVGWGGFHQPVRAEAAADYFRIRLWDAADLVEAVEEHYASLPFQIRAQIPLKQVWTLVRPEQEEAAA